MLEHAVVTKTFYVFVTFYIKYTLKVVPIPVLLKALVIHNKYSVYFALSDFIEKKMKELYILLRKGKQSINPSLRMLYFSKHVRYLSEW